MGTAGRKAALHSFRVSANLFSCRHTMGPAFILLTWAGLVIGFAIVSLLLTIVILRTRLLAGLRTRTESGNIVLAVTGRISFGESAPSSFFLIVLLRDGLYLHGLFSTHEIIIPGPSITYVGSSEHRKGPYVVDPVTVRFLNTEGKESGFLFHTLAPAPWVTAVKTQLFDR